jgi:hypothetical protein
MPKKQYTLKAYFNNIDLADKKATFLFLDDEIEPFTRKFLMGHYHHSQKNPINNGEFYVKTSSNTLTFIDKADVCTVEIQRLLDQVVTLVVHLKHYNFTNQNGQKIVGWNIHLVKMNPI